MACLSLLVLVFSSLVYPKFKANRFQQIGMLSTMIHRPSGGVLLGPLPCQSPSLQFGGKLDCIIAPVLMLAHNSLALQHHDKLHDLQDPEEEEYS